LIQKRTEGPSRDKDLVVIENEMKKIEDEQERVGKVTGRFVDSSVLQGNLQRFTVSDLKNQLKLAHDRLVMKLREKKEGIIQEELESREYGEEMENVSRAH
jgi:hypothetical protein